MRIKALFTCACTILLICSCQPKWKQTYDFCMDLSEEYIEKMDNANSLNEVEKIHRDFEKRAEFEIKKLSKKDWEEYKRDMSWEEKQEEQELINKRKQSYLKAKKRLTQKN